MSTDNKAKKAMCAVLSAVLLGMSLGIAPGNCGTTHQLQMPKHLPQPRQQNMANYGYTPDLLLVMPNKKAEQDDIDKSLKDVHGTVVGTIGQGALRVLVVRTEKGQIDKVERALKKDSKDFHLVSRNLRARAQALPPNDANFADEWYLGAINALDAWDKSKGNVQIGIFDSGCQASIDDLNGKTSKGFNAWDAGAQIAGGIGGLLGGALGMAAAVEIADATGDGAQKDVQGHGTMVATTAAARANNGVNTAGVAPNATVVPIQIAGEGGWTEDLALILGINYAMLHGIKIINISYQAPPPVGFTNVQLHPVLHEYLAAYFATGGLTFMSSGNDGMVDPNPPLPYLNVVSAIDRSFTLTNFSNYGTCVTFTAPGKDISCSSRSGSGVKVDGTSFSSPICASIAALVWNTNPGLSNVGVNAIMQASCSKAGSLPWTPYYGYGMPDAQKAVKLAGG